MVAPEAARVRVAALTPQVAALDLLAGDGAVVGQHMKALKAKSLEGAASELRDWLAESGLALDGCPVGKPAFGSEAEARADIETGWPDNRKPYRCSLCPDWHLTSQRLSSMPT